MNNPSRSIGDTFLFSLLILLTGSVVRMGASIYLPAIPEIGKAFGVSAAKMSHTLSIYFLVFALFTIIAGMLSDAYGRKKILISGLIFFIIGSTICALSKNFETILIGRAIQAFGASMIPGTLVAMVRDICSDLQVVRLLGWLAVLGGLFLVVAPIIGGFLTHFFGWSANFWFLILFSILVFFLLLFKIPETHPPTERKLFNLMRTLKLIFQMLKSRSFIMVMMPVIAFFTIQGAFLAGAPYIIMVGYKLSSIEFGISNIVIVIGLFIGQWLGTFLLKKGVTAAKVYHFGMFLSIIGAIFFILIALSLIDGLSVFLISVGFFAMIFGIMSPIGMKSSLTAYRKYSGVASALQGALLLGASAIGSGIFSIIMKNFNISALRAFESIAALLFLIVAISATKADVD